MYPMIRRSSVPTTRSLMDSIFEDDWGLAPIFGSLIREATPEIKTNVVASDKDYRIDIVIPGLNKEDINLEVNDTTIAISYEAKKDDDNIMSYRTFHRSWSLPKNTDPQNINAEYNQGILSVIIPKPDAEVPITHRIDIR